MSYASRSTIGDWRHIEPAYRQVSLSANPTTEGPSDRLAGHLAYRLGRTFAQYHDHEYQFITDLLECFAAVDGLHADREGFKRLYFDKRFNNFHSYAGVGRRGRPKPFEAAIETVRRLVATNALGSACRALPSAAILGGSVSYGRFYNTKGAANDASDLDLMIVLPDLDDSLKRLADHLHTVPGISSKQVAQLRLRADLLPKVLDAEEHACVSQTLPMWQNECDPLLEAYDIPCDYNIQLHIFGTAGFRYMLMDDMQAIESAGDELARRISDYRDDAPHRGNVTTEFCFAGTPKSSERSVAPVAGGFMAEEFGFFIHDDRFYPGIFQNLVMPRHEVRWDYLDEDVRLMITVFQNKVLDRLVREQQLRPWEDQTLANSHIRSRSFSPHIWRKVLNQSGDLL